MNPVTTDAEPVFDHLVRLTDERGLFEHACLTRPRPEHGYCVDDVARALVVTCREGARHPAAVELSRGYLDFVLAAVHTDGRCHNRMAIDGKWSDEPALGDWWGRALWALGFAAANAATPGMRARALVGFRIAAQARSPHRHALAFAALGAAELLRVHPEELSAAAVLSDLVAALPPPDSASTSAWPWPEPRLSYANGAVAEAVIVAGAGLGEFSVQAYGLDLLQFLLQIETRNGHLSVTPVAGRGPDDFEAGFDQQPIEVAAIADACASAYRVTSDPYWLGAIQLCWAWFLGDNDSATPMFDPVTGGGFDGLQPIGCNQNQGAESTLAMLSTAQQVRLIRQMR